MTIYGKAKLINGLTVPISTENNSLWEGFNSMPFEEGKRNINNILVHNENGPAVIWDNQYIWFVLDGTCYGSSVWSIKTNHLICKLCKNFCKQSCF